MFRNLLNPDNPLMITMSQVTDCIFLSLFWLLGCVPVLTLGASGAALYDASFRAFRRGDRHSWQRFLSVFRRNLKPGVLPSLVYAAVFWLGAKGLIFVWNGVAAGSFSWVALSLALLGVAVLLGILSVLFPMLSRFDNRFGTLLKNTLFLSLAHLPRTLALGVLNGVCIYFSVRYIFPLFFLPALSALLGSLLIEPMFRPYMIGEEGDIREG